MIAIGTDANYSKYAQVMLYQISKYSPWRDVCILVDGTAELEAELSATAVRHGLKPLTINVSGILDEHTSKVAKTRITRVAIARLLLPDLLPAQVEKVLYLDLDLLLRRSLEPICEFDLQLPLAVVGGTSNNGTVLHGKVDSTYFNSGVMLMDCRKWREFDSQRKFFELLDTGRPLRFMDEDLVNIVFKDHWQLLPLTSNLHIRQVRIVKDKALYDPMVIHFVGRVKPWLVAETKYARDWKAIQRESGIKLDIPLSDRTRAMRWSVIEKFGHTRFGKFVMTHSSTVLKSTIKRLFRF